MTTSQPPAPMTFRPGDDVTITIEAKVNSYARAGQPVLVACGNGRELTIQPGPGVTIAAAGAGQPPSPSRGAAAASLNLIRAAVDALDNEPNQDRSQIIAMSLAMLDDLLASGSLRDMRAYVGRYCDVYDSENHANAIADGIISAAAAAGGPDS